jgi:hypothetical protein
MKLKYMSWKFNERTNENVFNFKMFLCFILSFSSSFLTPLISLVNWGQPIFEDSRYFLLFCFKKVHRTNLWFFVYDYEINFIVLTLNLKERERERERDRGEWIQFSFCQNTHWENNKFYWLDKISNSTNSNGNSSNNTHFICMERWMGKNHEWMWKL